MTMALDELAVEFAILAFFACTFVNFSLDWYKASRIVFNALELVLHVAI